MLFLSGLISVYLLLSFTGFFVFKTQLKSSKFKARLSAAIMFTFTGITHIISPEIFLKIMPSFIPEPILMVYVSGVFEILGGIGLLIAKLKRLAATGLIILLIAIFPANIYAANTGIAPGEAFFMGSWYLWFRLLFQPVYIWWVWWSSLRPKVHKIFKLKLGIFIIETENRTCACVNLNYSI